MKTYQDFRKINEAAPTENPLQDIEKQIDALFDELKQKLHNPTKPRSDAAAAWDNWYIKNRHRYEWHRLEEYHAFRNYSQSLHEALTSEENLNAVLDEYKEKLKELIRTFASTISERKPRAAKPIPPVSTVPPKEEPVVPHTPTKPKEEPVSAVPTPVPPKPVPPKEEPAVPPKEEPAISVPPKEEPAISVPPKEEPAVPPTPVPKGEPLTSKPIAAEPEENEEETNLMKLGAAILFARDISGEHDVSPEDIQYGLEQPFKPKSHMSMKDIYIRIAKEYLQSKTDAKTAPEKQVEPEKQTYPTKGVMPNLPKPVEKSEEIQPTEDDFEAMTPKQFKAWVLQNDEEIARAYEGSNWWRPGELRSQMIDSILNMIRAKAKHDNKTESLNYKVNKYKEMLRQSNRPQIRLDETVHMPLAERISFYKKKLSCRDTF